MSLGEEYDFFLKSLPSFIYVVFRILPLGFHYANEWQELPLVHEVIFEKHRGRVSEALRLKRPLYAFDVMTPNFLDCKLIGSHLFEGICIAKRL